MAGRHHQCNEQELGQTLGDGEGQGGPWAPRSYTSPTGQEAVRPWAPREPKEGPCAAVHGVTKS